ncbi:MAG: chemotaxis protein CheW [Bacteroidetes bacterium]|nr:chemotaxis protein CheW [Bacteroidota bacterium]
MKQLNTIDQVVIFLLNKQRFAIPLNMVEQIIRAVEVTSVPNAPQTICGVINYHGSVIPVYDFHQRIGISGVITKPDNRFVITSMSNFKVALRVDDIEGIEQLSSDNLVVSESIQNGLDIYGVIKTVDRLVIVYNLEAFLNSDEINFLIQNDFDPPSNDVKI